MKRKLRVSSEDTQPPESASRKSVSDIDPLSVYLKQISYNKLLSIEEERELGIKIKKCKGDIANLLARKMCLVDVQHKKLCGVCNST